MINRLAVLSIKCYQRWISPHKGYACAYRVKTGGSSCSEHAIKSIKKYGLTAAIKLQKKQFQRCKMASFYLEDKRERDRNGTKWYEYCEPTGACDCSPW